MSIGAFTNAGGRTAALEPAPLAGAPAYTAKPPAKTFSQMRSLIIFFLLIVGVIPVSLGAIGIYEASKKEIVKSKGLYFREVASITALQVETILGEKIDAIGSLARLPMTRNLLTFPSDETIRGIEQLRRILMPEMARKYFVANIFNKKGEVIFSSELGMTAFDRQYHDIWENVGAADTDKIYVSDVLESVPQERHYYIEIYAPVIDDDGLRIGSIQARYKLDQLFDIVTSVRIGETGHANLVTSAGDILICPIFPPRSHSVSPELLRLITGGTLGWSIAGDDAHGSSGAVVGFAPVTLNAQRLFPGSLGGKEWYIFTRQDPEETFRPVKAFYKAVVGYAALLILLAFALGFLALRQILRAQREHQAAVVHKEKAESIKYLMASFQRMMVPPLNEFSKWLDETEGLDRADCPRPARLDKIKRHLDGINSLITHLSYYTQSEQFRLHPVDLSALMEDTLSLLDYMIASKSINLMISSPVEPVIVKGHPKLLNIVVMNIALNAIHAVSHEGMIQVRLEQSDGWARFSLRDDGTGISESNLENIFDPFYTTKKGHKGYGLGLAVSRGIIEKHEGHITVKSSVGAGTEVQVKLRLASVATPHR